MILLLVLLFVHIILSIYTLIRIKRTNLFSRQQKRLNGWLTVCVPLLWPLLMYYMLKKESVVFDEEQQHEHTTHHFYESGKAFIK